MRTVWSSTRCDRPIGPKNRRRLYSVSGRRRDRLGGLAGAGFPATGRGNGQVGLMLPLTGPSLTRPTLQRDRPDGGTVFVANHFAPGPCVGSADLGGATTHAKQALPAGGQAGHGPPVLCTCGFCHAHCCSSPPATAIHILRSKTSRTPQRGFLLKSCTTVSRARSPGSQTRHWTRPFQTANITARPRRF